ncbi:MAG: hypothetical protein H8E28_07620 [Anaerolineae bacterium]|nr:hypothetical protein [Anaerolineae bacterium]MBL6966579.1 hypothetical protein [Anaerolineales bacterium]
MIKPAPLHPQTASKTIGRIFNTPVVVVGKTWLPVTQFIVGGFLAWQSSRKHPQRPMREHLMIGAGSMAVMLGSEWGHNLAHAAAARLVEKPMDALRITLGMPLCVYHEIDDLSVTPREHIIRALGGPVFNGLLLGLMRLLRPLTSPNSIARKIADAGVGMNLFLSTVSLAPIPGIDGGPILKWGLVAAGRTPAEADAAVVQVNKVTGLGMGIAAGAAFKKKRRFLGGMLTLFAATSIAIGFGWLREQ